MLKVLHVSKSFPGVQALDDVSIEFEEGEIHALLGENGAGKSTLIKIISGLYTPDRGSEIYYLDEPYSVHNTREALERGIHTVYQELQVIPEASVAENIMLDKLPTRGKTGILSWKKMNEIAKHHLDEIGLDIDPTINIGRLSVAQRQLVEIAKAISSDIRLLLLDEPTASLSKDEAAYLFRIMDKLKKEGVLVIFVSHVLEEVLQVADRVSVLRDGRCVVTDQTSNLNRKKIVRSMIGRDEDTSVFGGLSINEKEKVLEVKGLTRDKMAYDINFSLFKGEILGFYGLVGSGRTELAHILIGKEKYDSGQVFVNGRQVRIRSIYEALSRYRMGYVTEDRRRDGLIMLESVKTNTTITVWDRLKNKFGLVSGKEEREITWEQIGNLNIKATGIHQKVGKLSGGNQQKVNVAKWLAASTDILIIDEPTVGVDVGAKEYFTKLIWRLAENKKSIILISSDMPEIIKLAHRILVFSENRIVGEVDNSSKDYQATSTQIGDLISEFRVMATAE